MKKLLLILMLGAGFVTVASANTTLDCRTNTTNQCCVDVANIESAISQAPTHTYTTSDGYALNDLAWVLWNDGSDNGYCEEAAQFTVNGSPAYSAQFRWTPGSWLNAIVYDGPGPSVNKDNAIIIIPGNKDNIIIH